MLTSWQNPMATPPFAPPQPGAAQAQSNAPWLDRLATGLLGTAAVDMTPEQQKAARQQGLLALGAQLMSGSGPSPTRVSLGQALGPALMAGQQAQRQYGQDMLAEMLLKTKLQTAGQTSAQKDYQYAIANGYKGTFEDWKRAGAASPSGIQEYEYAKANGFQGSFEDWKRVSAAQQQTPSAVAEYEYYQKLNPKQQQEFMSLQRQPTTPQLAIINGVPTLVDKIRGTQTPLTDLQSEVDAARVKAAGEGEGSAQGAGTGKRFSTFIDEGMRAADSLPIINRSLELLDSVKTGGIDAAKLAATNLLGVTGADEAELSNNLGKAVLSQLRTTFGAQFTEREGARLDALEANFGKSTEGNKRILQQVKQLVERSARRGIDAAERTGDVFSADEMKRSIQMTLNPASRQTQQSASPEAIEYLRQNPQFKDAFRQKYGYLPDGL